jgi:hypothetical protein
MSVYAINEVCYKTVHDPDFRERLRADPGAALAPFDLTEAERTALLAGEVGTLYRMGAHSFLLGHLNRYQLLGLTVPVYNERMRAAR